MLRTQLPELAEKRGYKSLPWLIISVLTIVSGALLNIRLITLIGIIGYFCAWLLILSPHLRFILQKKSPFSFISTVGAITWLFIALINLGIDTARSDSWHAISDGAESLIYMLAIGFALQIGLGALSYLIPVVLGGGPTNARRNVEKSGRCKRTRLLTLNTGLVLVVLNFSRASFLIGCVLLTLALILNLYLLGSLRPAKHN